MRYSKSLIPTLREIPADAEAISHRLLVRAGLVRQLAAGIYVWLPLGQRVLDKINAIIREEMNAIGGQEITMPVLQPAEIWRDSGRWDAIGDEMFRLRDRYGRDMCLGMTHEEVVAWLAAHEGAYRRIFDRCGIKYHVVESDPGMMGGLGSHEFMAPSAAGEDEIALCARCGYAANVELARGQPPAPAFPAAGREEVATPGARTIAEVCAALGIEPALTIKSLFYVAEKSGPVLALVRGDHALHERKLARALGEEFRPARPEEARQHLGAPVGSIGPVGARVPVVADETLRDGTYVVGANREDAHLRGVVPGRDFECRFVDLQTVVNGDGCPRCGAPLAVERVIEVGNIFKLGTKYSVPLGANYLDESGREQPIVMGSYGIGPARIAAAAVEQSNDADGIAWPWSIAPFHVHIVVVSLRDPAQVAAAERLYDECRRNELEVLLDDRDERPGVKFKDADLLGAPVRVTIGNALTKEGMVEVRARRTRDERRVPLEGVLTAIREVSLG